MDKIYSRKRFLIPKINWNGRGRFKFNNSYRNRHSDDNERTKSEVEIKQVKKIIKLLTITLIAVCIANRVISSIEPVINASCKEMARAVATRICNEQATLVMQNYKYEDISNIVRDEQGNIRMIQINSVVVNSITSDVALKIQDELNNYHTGDFSIKMGSFTGTKIMSGRGPDIQIKMSTAGNVETNLVSQFSQAGINQTLHRIYLNVDCTVSILTPYDTIDEKISNQILLAEAVIVGDVPDTYYNLNGITNDDLIETLK